MQKLAVNAMLRRAARLLSWAPPVCMLLIISLNLTACTPSRVPPEAVRTFAEGSRLYMEGNLEGALERFQRVRKAAPRFEANLFLMGKTHFFLKEYAQAEEAWKETIRLRPDHLDGRKWLARLYLLLVQPAQARDVLQPVLSSASSDPGLLILAAKIERERGEFALAIEYYEKALLFREQFAEASLELARIYLRAGLRKEARQTLEGTLSLLGPKSSLTPGVTSLLDSLVKEERR